MSENQIMRGSVVEIEPARQRGARSSHGSFGIVWKVDGSDALWLPVVNQRHHAGTRTRTGNLQRNHRSDMPLDAAQALACGFVCPRPVIECRRLLRRPLAMFAGKRVISRVPEPIMARIYSTMVDEARRMAAELGRAA